MQQGEFNVFDFGAHANIWIDDTAAFQAALNSIAASPFGGTLKIPSGYEYRINDTLTWECNKELHIDARGARIHYPGSSSMFVMHMNSTIQPYRGPKVYGGRWTGTPNGVAAFELKDVCYSQFDNLTFWGYNNGTGILLHNTERWCERNAFYDIDVQYCRHGIRFQVDTGAASSFARTVIERLQISGGMPAYAQIHIPDNSAVYDSVIGPIHGNIAPNVRVLRLGGWMKGSVIKDIGTESGAPTSYIFEVGTLTGTRPKNQNGWSLHNGYSATYVTPPTSPVWDITVAQEGLKVEQSGTYQGLAQEGRRTAIIVDPQNPSMYLSAPSTSSAGYPLDSYGHLVIQAARYRDVTILGDDGSVAARFSRDGCGFFGVEPTQRINVVDTGNTEQTLNNLLNALTELGLIGLID